MVGLMQELNMFFSRLFLVSIGSILGSWVRFNATRFFQLTLGKNSWGTMIVNISASFGLGFLVAIDPLPFSEKGLESLHLLLGIGFLGSMSTFSSFVFDLMEEFFHFHYKNSFMILTFSLIGGLFAAGIGYKIGNA